ncbi:hypothetical protein HDU96_008568 [Phlyctochytrium bullatum]|nr:hypothetical protein HDU96_008568 [Phlyctochytrium bullatum]
MDKSLPLSKQFERCLQLLAEKSRIVAAQDIKIREIENRIHVLSDKLKEERKKGQSKDSKINMLQQNILHKEARDQDEDVATGALTRSLAIKEESRAIQITQELLASLQKQLRSKDDLVDKYRKMLNEARKELRMRVEVVETGSEIFQKASDSSSLHPHIEQLEAFLNAKATDIERLERIISDWEKRHEDYKHHANKEIHSLQLEIENLKKHGEQQEDYIYSLKEELRMKSEEFEVKENLVKDAEAARVLPKLEKQLSAQGDKLKATQKLLKEAEARQKKTENKKHKLVEQGIQTEGKDPVSTRDVWDFEKKIQQKVVDLKAKLKDKNYELEEQKRKELSLRESIERIEREKSRWQKNANIMSEKLHRLRRGTSNNTSALNDSISDRKADLDVPPSELELHTKLKEAILENNRLQEEIFRLEDAVSDLKNLARVEQANEISRLSQESEKSDLGLELERDAEPGERSRRLVLVLESRIRDLLKRIQVLEEDAVSLKSELLQATFEKDRAISEAKRCERRINNMQSLQDLKYLEEKRNEYTESNGIPGLNVSLGQIRVATTRLLANKTHDEIVGVVDHLSRALEKLKYENENLRKSGSSNTKYMEMLKELKILRKEKADLSDLQKSRASAAVQASKLG